MKRFFSLHSFVSLILLLIIMGALVIGLKEGVHNTKNAEFFPVAAFAVTLAYILGFSKWSARRAWTLIAISGLLLIFIESARLIESFKVVIGAIPQFEMDLLRWLFQKEKAEILFPNTTIFQEQFTQISTKANAFTSRLFSGSIKHASVREFIWDVQLLGVSAWAGWEIKRGRVLFALLPSLAIHAYVLYYADKDTLTLQIHVFAMILLLGLALRPRRGGAEEKNENTERAARETRSALLVLAIALSIIAGFTPSISIKGAAQRLSQNGLANSLGLEREFPRAYAASGLPRQHLIGLNTALSKKIIFTVKTGELPASENVILKEAAPRHYWRWLIFDIYNGSGWTTSTVESKSYFANVVIQPMKPQHKIIRQQVKKFSTQDTRLYWTGSLLTTNRPFDASWRVQPTPNPLAVDMLGGIVESQNYQVDSIVSIVSANELRASPQSYPQEIQKYLQVSATTPRRVIDLANELTQNSNNPYDKAKSIETYLRTYPYSLKIPPPPPNRDIADYFLFDLKTGYCDYYATSMIVLARAAGLPARLVIGYSSGIYNPQKAEYTVREENAHSWVEIYFADIGWVEFEPTASQPALTLPDDPPLKNKLSGKNILENITSTGYAKNKGFNQRLSTFALIATLPILLIWFLYTQGFFTYHKTIRSIYRYVFYHGKKIYRNTPPHETASIFAEKLKSKIQTQDRHLRPALNEIDFLTALYLRETYSTHPITREEQKSAQKIWGKLFWRLQYAALLFLIQRQGASASHSKK